MSGGTLVAGDGVPLFTTAAIVQPNPAVRPRSSEPGRPAPTRAALVIPTERPEFFFRRHRRLLALTAVPGGLSGTRPDPALGSTPPHRGLGKLGLLLEKSFQSFLDPLNPVGVLVDPDVTSIDQRIRDIRIRSP